jgi:hypothetical protein
VEPTLHVCEKNALDSESILVYLNENEGRAELVELIPLE